jgi:glycosyltransferase involved in cell wall biosynthesis
MTPIVVSVVIPIFNEERTLPELRRRLVPALESVTADFEVIFVDDGSSDASPELLAAMGAEDRRLKTAQLRPPDRPLGRHRSRLGRRRDPDGR